MPDLIQVELDDFAAIFVSWRGNVNLTVEAAWAQESGIERFGDIACADGQYRLGLNTTMIEAERTQDLLKPPGLNVRRAHLHQQFIQAARAAHCSKEAPTHCHRTNTTLRTRHTNGIEFVHEHHAGSIL